MICNPKVKLNIMRDAVQEEYSSLLQEDHNDPDIQMRIANNRRVKGILEGNDADAIERELFGMSQDLKDPLTNNFKTILTGSDNKLTIKVGKGTRTEEVKAVQYIKGDTQDYIEVATYPTTKPHSVRTYTFAVGQDTGKGRQVVTEESGKKGEYTVSVKGIGRYSKYLRNKRDSLGSSKASEDLFNDTAKKVNDYVHGNINKMKDVFNSFSPNTEYGKHGRELLSSFKPKFFKDMELFIGEVEGEAQGRAGVKHIEVYKSKVPSSDRGAMDAAEVYLHEVIHTMTRFALDEGSDKAQALSRELDSLVREAQRSFELEELYPENATQTEKDIIKARYDYMFNNDSGADIGNQEFLAIALTNPAMMEKLKSIKPEKESMNLLEKVIDFFKKLSRILLGEMVFETKDKSLYERAYNIAYRLGEINIDAEEKVSMIGKASDKVMDLVNMMDEYVAERTQAVKDKVSGDGLFLETYPRYGSRAEKIAYAMKFVKFGMTTPEGRELAGAMFSSFGVDSLTAKGSFREFVGSFFERSDTEKASDWLGLAAGKIDTMRESVVNTNRSVIFDAFDGELKEFEDEALTKYLIDTNLGVIYKKHGIEGVKKFLESEQATDKELENLKKKLSKLDNDNYNWLSAQAHGLGYYMATHKSNIAQNLNSYNIANGFMAEDKVVYKEKVEEVVSEIAALTALKYSRDTDVDVIVDLINRKEEGVTTVINMYESFKTDTRETMFKDDPVHMVEGYSSEQFNSDIEVKILPQHEATKLKSLGYKKVKDLGRKDKDGNLLSMYVSGGYGVKERLRGAAKLVSMASKGTSIAEIIYAKSLNPELALRVENGILDSKRSKMAKQMAEGSFDVTKLEDSMMPLMNSEGQVIGYRYNMDKRSKKEFLEQDTRLTEVLPRSKGHLIDKIYTLDHNEKVLEFIKDDMEENFRGKRMGGSNSLTPYIMISKKSPNKEYRELYKMLPRSFKEYAESREDGTIAVPESLYYPIFGYDHISIVNNKAAKKLPEFVVRIAGLVEELWMDLVKVVKGNILMKMPIVLIGNIVSNFMLRVVNGAEPLQLMKDYYKSFKDVREFTKFNREILRLESEVAIAKEELLRGPNSALSKEIAKKESLITRYKNSNDKNPVKELVDAGLYQAIVEDVEVSTIEGKTVWDKLGDKTLGKLPEGVGSKVRTGTDILFFNQRTTWFKVNQEIMQLSDLVARDVQNRTAKAMERKHLEGRTNLPAWWIQEKGWDKKRKLKTAAEKAEFEKRSRELRMYALLENYVNYSRPSGRGEEYLNRMGVLMFTKYAKRIQKVVMDQGTNHPIKTMLALFADNALMDMSTIQDSHILAKEWHLDSHGAGNFYPVYSPLEHIENFVTPALIKDSTWDFLPI